MPAEWKAAAEILEQEIRKLRRILNLEIQKARGLQAGEIDQALAAQEECDRIVADLRTLPESFSELPAASRPTRDDLRADPVLRGPYAEFERLLEQIQTLGAQNQDRVRHLMNETAAKLRKLHRNRLAMRGYDPRAGSASRLLDENL